MSTQSSFILAMFLAQVISLPVLFAETIYKGKDANGNPTFSDTPSPDSQKIEITPIQTYTPPAMPGHIPDSNASNMSPITAYEISITSPQNDETFTTDIQTIPVSIAITPLLQHGDKIQFFLNDQPYGKLTSQLSLELGRLDRGTYLIKANIIGPDGKTKAESKTVTFYQHRTSILNPNNPINHP